MATEIAAKGDLIVGTGAATFDNLTAGSNGETLVADSSTTTGLRYTQNYAAGKNKIINGDFGVWQRGTSFSNPVTGSYIADRFFILHNSTGATRTYSQETFTPGTAPVAGYEGTFFLRYARTVAGSLGTVDYIGQKLEDVRIFAGQTATLSFWAKVDSGTPTLTLRARQNFGSGGSGLIDATDVSITLSTSWTRYIATFAIPSISGKTIGTNSVLEIQFRTAVNTIQTLDLWGVQLEAGSVATAFQTASGSIAGELALAQRYYYRSTIPVTNSPFGNGFADSTTGTRIIVPYPVEMRTNPTALEQSGTAADYQIRRPGGTNVACSAVPTFSAASKNVGQVVFTVASGLTTGEGLIAQSAAVTTAFLGWSAEL
jgi:hypothetical protein